MTTYDLKVVDSTDLAQARSISDLIDEQSRQLIASNPSLETAWDACNEAMLAIGEADSAGVALSPFMASSGAVELGLERYGMVGDVLADLRSGAAIPVDDQRLVPPEFVEWARAPMVPEYGHARSRESIDRIIVLAADLEVELAAFTDRASVRDRASRSADLDERLAGAVASLERAAAVLHALRGAE